MSFFRSHCHSAEQAVRHLGGALLGFRSYGVHVAEIFPAVRVHDHRRAARGRLIGLPEEKLLSIALERDLDEMGHGYSAYCPIRKNFSRRRRTSLSGLSRRSSSSCRTSVS